MLLLIRVQPVRRHKPRAQAFVRRIAVLRAASPVILPETERAHSLSPSQLARSNAVRGRCRCRGNAFLSSGHCRDPAPPPPAGKASDLSAPAHDDCRQLSSAITGAKSHHDVGAARFTCSNHRIDGLEPSLTVTDRGTASFTSLPPTDLGSTPNITRNSADVSVPRKSTRYPLGTFASPRSYSRKYVGVSSQIIHGWRKNGNDRLNLLAGWRGRRPHSDLCDRPRSAFGSAVNNLLHPVVQELRKIVDAHDRLFEPRVEQTRLVIETLNYGLQLEIEQLGLVLHSFNERSKLGIEKLGLIVQTLDYALYGFSSQRCEPALPTTNRHSYKPSLATIRKKQHVQISPDPTPQRRARLRQSPRSTLPDTAVNAKPLV